MMAHAMSDQLEYVYIIRLREFIRLNEQTYKIGKTKRTPMKRMIEHPNESEIIAFISVRNCTAVENDIKKTFAEQFIQMKRYGTEYFYGDPTEMLKALMVLVAKHVEMRENFEALLLAEQAEMMQKKMMKLAAKDAKILKNNQRHTYTTQYFDVIDDVICEKIQIFHDPCVLVDFLIKRNSENEVKIFVNENLVFQDNARVLVDTVPPELMIPQAWIDSRKKAEKEAMESANEDRKKFQCHCGKTFASKQRLEYHTESRKMPCNLKCRTCHTILSTKKLFKRHMKAHERQEKRVRVEAGND